jgi:hypothetical protein
VRKIATKKAEEARLKRVNLNIPLDLHNSFKSATAAQGLDMTTVLMQYIREYVDKYSGKGKGRRQ